MNSIDVELHDARFCEVTFSPLHQTVLLTVDAYESSSSSERRRLNILFEGVKDFHASMDSIALADNFKSGNVNYWSPAAAPKRTHVYFSDGHIEILAEKYSVTDA